MYPYLSRIEKENCARKYVCCVIKIVDCYAHNIRATIIAYLGIPIIQKLIISFRG